MNNEYRARLKKFHQLREHVDALLFFGGEQPSDYMYVSGTTAQGFLLYDFSRARLYTNAMEISRARRSSPHHAEVRQLTDVLEELRGKTVGVNYATTPAQLFQLVQRRAKTKDITNVTEAARACKTPQEVCHIRKACNISRQSFSHTDVRTTATELTIAADIECAMRRRGADRAFPTIVASGSNIQFPHHEPTLRRARRPLLIDFGARYHGYCSDITRMIGSSYTSAIEKVFAAVEELLAPNVRAAQLDARARDVLGHHARHFVTSLGHGIGLDVHERPWISSQSTDVLKTGMTFTIEPGIYVPNGIRIENDYLITHTGFRNLTDW